MGFVLFRFGYDAGLYLFSLLRAVMFVVLWFFVVLFLIVSWGVFLIAFIFYLGGERLDVVPFRTVSCLSGLACHVATGAGFRGGVYLRFFL